MMFEVFKPKQILILEAERGLASDHLEAARSGQKGLSSADWPVPNGIAANLATQNSKFHLYTDRLLGIGRLFRSRKRVPLEIRDSCPQEDTGQYVSAVIFVSATGDFEKAGELLDGFIQAIAREDYRALHSVLIVITDALSLHVFRPPPIDAIDAWSTMVSGGSVPMAPAVIARDPRNWFGAYGKFDRRLGNRMDRLNDVLSGARIKSKVYPVAQFGFRATTGEFVAHTQSEPKSDAVSFNLFYLDRRIASTLPSDLFSPTPGTAG